VTSLGHLPGRELNFRSDGSYPQANLIMDGAGNLYGTTSSGGGNGRGVVFQVTPDEIGTAWNETVLYSFCSQTNCADGAGPLAGLISQPVRVSRYSPAESVKPGRFPGLSGLKPNQRRSLRAPRQGQLSPEGPYPREHHGLHCKSCQGAGVHCVP
jgi:uncharacterized repeat protein (TIGR03803 family)